MAKNKIIININDRDYTILSEESTEYMEKVGQYIEKKIGEIVYATGGKLTMNDVAVLTAINIADEYFKSEEVADNLRSQIKQYIDDASSATFENSQLKSENARLKSEISALKRR